MGTMPFGDPSMQSSIWLRSDRSNTICDPQELRAELRRHQEGVARLAGDGTWHAPAGAARADAGGHRHRAWADLGERSLEEVKRPTKLIDRFPDETSCMSRSWTVLDLSIASARGLGLSALEYRQLA